MALQFLNSGYFAGKVGIGIDSPSSQLAVASTGANPYSATLDSTSNMKGIRNVVTSNTDDMVGIYFATGTTTAGTHWSGITGSRTDNATDWGTQLNFYTHNNSTSGLTLATQKMVIKGDGNVGIGTTNPLTKLHIAGTTDANIIRIENTVTALSSGDTIGAIQFFNNDTTDDSPNVAASIYATAGASGGSGSLRFKTTEPGTDGDPATDTMIITNGGNVGIGTSSPQSKLHLATTGSSTLTIQNTTNSGNAALNFRDEGDNDQFQIYYALGANRSYNLVNGNGLTIYSSQSSSEIARFGNASSGYTDSYFTGNVGIGTTSPVGLLHLYDGSPVIQIMTNSGADGQTSTTMGRIIGQARGYGMAGDEMCSIDFETNATAWYKGDIVFKTNDSDGTDPSIDATSKMRILSNGNVGIGTDSPSEKLDVVGNIELNGVLYIGSRGIYQQENTDVSGLELVANASTSLYRAAFFDYVIQKTGNVRAGTVFACNDGGSVEYTETSTNDLGDTSDVVLSVDISGGNMRLLADAATSGWSVKSLIRAI